MSETKIVKTTCSTCGPCCEVDAYVKDGKLISVEGSRNTPMQSGGLCAKGVAATQYVYNKERILYPMKRAGKKGEGKFERISWDEAYAMIAEELLRIRGEYGARSTVFYAGYAKWYRPALCGLPMLMDRRISVRSPVPVSRRPPLPGVRYTGTGSAGRILRTRRH